MTDDALLATLRTAPNFRDLGGRATVDRARVRSGVVFRSGALTRLDDTDLATLRRLGARQVCDLRTVFERERWADQVPEGAEYVVLDVQSDHKTGGDLAALLSDAQRAHALLENGGAERFMHEVSRMLVSSDDACAGYRELVERVAHGPLPLVFHCSAGKDRTGWGAVVLLELLGVPRPTITADYLLSNERLAHLVTGESEHATGEVDFTLVKPMLEVRREYLRTAYAEVADRYGSMSRYMTEGLKLSTETVVTLRRRLLRGVD